MENKTKKQMLHELKQTNAWAFKHLNNSRSLKDVKEIYEGYFALRNNTQEIENCEVGR